MMAAAAVPATALAAITASLASRMASGVAVSASVMRKRHMVKPTPASSPHTSRCFSSMPSGQLAMPALMDARLKAVMPSGLPSSSPAAMPTATGCCTRALIMLMSMATAVLARAKRGMTISAVYGSSLWMRWSISVGFMSGSSGSASEAGGAGAVPGMASAATTPAMSALTPEHSRQYHSATPPTAYCHTRTCWESLGSMNIAAVTAAEAARKGTEMLFAKKRAITAMAPRSSTVARVRRKAEALRGIFLLKKAKIPQAKAMSVAMGMAQPAMMPPFAALIMQ
mmetsp:Transcript_21879/g.48035  ORF Transcript_21879/g.48035 Transcript_21879/m.48035 type:complete len:283 (-) Transcript_21879:852-1700(-)